MARGIRTVRTEQGSGYVAKSSDALAVKRDGIRKSMQPIYRYWLEVRDRRDDSLLTIPIIAVRTLALVPERRAAETYFRIEDPAGHWKARDFEALRTRLRERYPDVHFERTLKVQRDEAAETRRAERISELINVLVEALVRKVEREEAGERTAL